MEYFHCIQGRKALQNCCYHFYKKLPVFLPKTSLIFDQILEACVMESARRHVNNLLQSLATTLRTQAADKYIYNRELKQKK